jgi:hypothetical protein
MSPLSRVNPHHEVSIDADARGVGSGQPPSQIKPSLRVEWFGAEKMNFMRARPIGGHR